MTNATVTETQVQPLVPTSDESPSAFRFDGTEAAGAPPPQISFTLGNPGAPNTVYVSDDAKDNALTLLLTPNVAVAVTPATLVKQSEAGAATGSLFYLDLQALGIDATSFDKFALDNDDWISAPFSADGQIGFSPKAAGTLAAAKPVSFKLTGFVLPTAPSKPSVALKLDTYHAAPVARGTFPSVTTTLVAATPPPAGKDDLRKALTAAILPQAIALSESGTPSVSNRLTLTLSQIAGGLSAIAGDKTVFTLSVVYASDQYGYGALMTTDQGQQISIPVPQAGGWTPTNSDGLQGRSWQLVPDSGMTLPSADGSPIAFDFEPIVSKLQPGPTVLLLSYSGVSGFADGAFAMTLIKEPHVKIDSFTATPALTALDKGHAAVKLSWTTAHAGRLFLDPVKVDVTGKTSFDATISDTTTFTLTAYGSGSGDVDNMAIANASTTVIPVLNGFEAAPGAISLDDFQGGSASLTLRWSVNAPPKSKLQLSSSLTGPFSTQFDGLGMTTLNVTQPQLFSLNVMGDLRPQDQWRLYAPVFTLKNKEPSNTSGAYAVAAPGASYVAVSQANNNRVVMLSTASYTQIGSINIGTSPQDLVFAPDGETIYVANQGDGTIGIILVTTSSQATPPWSFSTLQPLSIGGPPVRLALAPSQYLYATIGGGTGPGALAMISLDTRTTSYVTVGHDPYGVAVTPSGAQVFVANRGDGTVSQIGISPLGRPQLIRTIGDLPGAAGVAVTPDGNSLLVACSDGTVQMLDATSPDTSPRVAVQVGGRPMNIALDPSGSYAFVTDNSGNRVALISIAKQAVLGNPVSVAAAPIGVSVSPDGMLVFAGHAASLSVISLETYVLRSNPPNCGGYVTDVAVGADGKSAFVWADASVKIKGSAPAVGLLVYDVPSETLRATLPDATIIQMTIPIAAKDIGFLTQKGQSALYPFDTKAVTLGIALPIPPKGGATSRQPLAVAAADDASRVFVLVSDGSNQFSIAVFTNGNGGYTLTDDVSVYTASANPIEPKLAAAPDGSAAYAYDGTQDNLWSITLSGGAFKLGQPLQLGIATAAGILVSPDGSTLYIAGQQQLATAFYIVDTAAWTFQRVALAEPVNLLAIRSMALSPDGTRIVISDPTGGTIRFIDAASIRFLQTIVDPGSFKAPTGVAMTPDQSRLFVADLSGLFATASQVRAPAGEESTEALAQVEAPMAASNPYFIRHQMGDTPGNNGGSFSSCPDIIFSTTGAPGWTPISVNPSTFLTTASYNTDYGSTIQVSKAGNVNNFVYLRALNTNPQANVPVRLWMMYVQSDMALWPQNWRSDSIKVGNEVAARNWQDGQLILSGGPGPYIVTGQPFLWSPTPPDAGQHYCVISMVEPFPNADPPGTLSDPPFAPPSSIGYLNTFDQLVQFVLSNDWFGWRNTIDVSSLGATWQQTIPVTGPDAGGQVYVGVACNNMPVDGYVSAYMAGPDVNNSLNLPKSPITTPNMNLTVPITLPAKFKTKMIITYWQGNTAPPYQASITPVLTLPAAQVLALMAGKPIKRAPAHFAVHHNVTNELLGWKKMHVFGSVPLAWQTPPPMLRGMVGVPRQLPTVVPLAKDPGATWQHSYPIDGPPDGRPFYAGIQCIDMPTDGRVGFDVIGPMPNDGADIPPTQITGPDMSILVPLTWPPSAAGTITISYWQGPTPVPPGAGIEVVLMLPAPPALSERPDNAPTCVNDTPVTGPAEGGDVFVGLRCQDIPTNGNVGFSLSAPTPPPGQPTPPPLVTIPPSLVTNPDMTLMARVSLPPQYQGTLTISYWQGATQPPPDARIIPMVMLPEGQAVDLAGFHPTE